MLVSLYTVRIILNTLGTTDYGIYNVVAGVIVLFSFVTYAMTSSTQRYLNFSIGEKNTIKTQKVYSASIAIHVFISILFIMFAETIGLWFVIYKLNIPADRRYAAEIVYQFTILNTVFSIFRAPYNAVIIAYEKMSFFAEISIVEAFCKLGLALLVKYFHFDKLILYSILLCVINVVIFLSYKFYCNLQFEIAHFKKVRDKSLIKELFTFSGWNLLGSVANIANSQGTNIVLNLFTNVVVNAAMGIANQVNSAVYSFVSNFQTAFNPQIVKSYAEKDNKYFFNLIYRSSRISFFLLFIISLPLILNCEFVLSLWLKKVPEYSIEFVDLILVWSLMESLNGPLWMAVQATGRIKTYQIFVSSMIFANLPLSIIAFELGCSPLWIFYIRIFINVIVTVYRVIYLHIDVKLSCKTYCLDVILRSLLWALVGTVIPLILSNLLFGITKFFITCITSVICNVLSFSFIGLNRNERVAISKLLKSKIGIYNDK
jgi:O-antigen/teichoic acid export membrane protein